MLQEEKEAKDIDNDYDDGIGDVHDRPRGGYIFAPVSDTVCVLLLKHYVLMMHSVCTSWSAPTSESKRDTVTLDKNQNCQSTRSTALISFL